ncbi:MAG: metallophosphoesterase family protein [Calditrichaeota bacterium]|nr:metallophosphoesterase family protein [Calditrichota bacterium]
MKRVGLISDTHGSVHPEVFRLFDGVDLILHAGDVDSATVLSDLEVLAPVLAVKGNMDAEWTLASLPALRVIEVEGHNIALIHNRRHLTAELLRAGVKPTEVDVLVYGHTHLAEWHREGKLLVVNPGSARAGTPKASVGFLEVAPDRVDVKLVQLERSDEAG